MSVCTAEMCGNWTGDGCICAVFDMEPTCGACESGMHEHCERTRRGLACCCNDEDADR